MAAEWRIYLHRIAARRSLRQEKENYINNLFGVDSFVQTTLVALRARCAFEGPLAFQLRDGRIVEILEFGKVPEDRVPAKITSKTQREHTRGEHSH